MLIDEFLSEYDFVEKHDISIRADAETIYRAANDVDFCDSFIIRWLFRLRGLSGSGVTLRSLQKSRFEMLGEIPNRELLLGLAGRFWTPGGDLKKIDAESFKSFNLPGYAKAVWNFSLASEAGGNRLTTETRVKCLDETSRTSFGWYWMLIRPFSGLIRMEMLRAIKHRAETI